MFVVSLSLPSDSLEAFSAIEVERRLLAGTSHGQYDRCGRGLGGAIDFLAFFYLKLPNFAQLQRGKETIYYTSFMINIADIKGS